MATKRSAVTVPSGFMQNKPGYNKAVEIVKTNHSQLLEHGSFLTAETLEIFGGLLGPKNGPSTVSPMSTERYLQNVSLETPYENRVVPMFGDIVTYNMNGTGNSFLTQVICPPWNTPERNFTMNRKEFNHIAFTPIGEHGVPDEQTHFTYSWSNSVDRCALNDTIDRDLALDPNFGAQAWLDSLSQFSVNATLTIELGIIFGALHRGYTNLIEERNRRGVFNHHKLNETEANEAGIFALDQARGFAAIRNYENKIPELDTVIGPAGFSQYIRDIQGEQKTVPSQKLWTNPETQKLMIDFYNDDSVTTLKTIPLGSRHINFYELNPIAINTRNPVRYQPLIRKITWGEFYPPFPDETAFDNNTSLDPSRQDMHLCYMTKNICDERKISLQQRIRNALYYAKDGKVAGYITDYIKALNVAHDLENTPWSWNKANQVKDNYYKTKYDQAHYDHPDISAVKGKQTIAEMPFREIPWGIGFNPEKSMNPYYEPGDIGSFMPSQISGDWVLAAAKKIALASQQKLDVSDITELFSNLKTFIGILRDAEWNDLMVEAIIDKNLSKILVSVGAGEWTVREQTTDRKKLVNFPGANPVGEFRTNVDGALDLPERSGALKSTIPPGHANAVGIMRLALEADKPQSLWGEIGTQAKTVLRIFQELYNLSNETIGKTKSTDPAWSYPWSVGKGLATFIDSFIDVTFGISAPLFLGVPPKANSFNVTKAQTKAEARVAKNVIQVTIVNDFNELLKTDLPTQDKDGKKLNYLIGPKERALASVTSVVGEDLQTLIYGDEKKYTKELCKLLIEIAGYTATGSPVVTRIASASYVAANVIRMLGVEKVTDDKISEYVAGFNGTKTQNNKLIADAANLNQNAAKDANADRMANLRKYEKGLNITGAVSEKLPEEGKSAEDLKKEEEALKQRQRGEFYKGDYEQVPLRFLRTPLTYTPQLGDYLRNKAFSYVLPGDPDYFYELPIELDSFNEKGEPMEEFNEEEAVGVKGLFQFTANRTLQSFSSLNNNANGNQQQQNNPMNFDKRTWYGKKKKDKKNKNKYDDDSDDSDNDDNIFASLKSKSGASTKKGSVSARSSSSSSTSSSFISDLLNNGNLGNLGMEFSSGDNFARKHQKRSAFSGGGDSASATSSTNIDDLTDELFEGGWDYHKEYMEHEVVSDAHKLFYRLIIEAPNTIEIHLKLASINAHIVNVMLVRPFIQAHVHALLLCKAGPQTWIYAFGHSTVQVTKELRGLFHLGCGFEHGMIETNPDNVAVMPAPLFHSFDGGKKVDFMTNPADWNQPNPTKPSMMAFLIPNDEKTFSSPTHLRNMETYSGPDGDYAIWERKCSAFGGLYDHIFHKHNPKKADIVESNRVTFNSVNTIAHVLHLGCVAYTDPNTGRKIDRPGVGPLGERRANMPGAQLVMNGQSFRFPDYSQYLMTTQAF